MPRKPLSDSGARNAMLRVSRADLDRWTEIAQRHGYASVYDLITVAIEQLDPDDNEGRLADLGRHVVEMAGRLK